MRRFSKIKIHFLFFTMMHFISDLTRWRQWQALDRSNFTSDASFMTKFEPINRLVQTSSKKHTYVMFLKYKYKSVEHKNLLIIMLLHLIIQALYV